MLLCACTSACGRIAADDDVRVMIPVDAADPISASNEDALVDAPTDSAETLDVDPTTAGCPASAPRGWRRLASMPVGISGDDWGTAAVWTGREVLVVSPLALQSYDPLADAWSLRAAPPYPEPVNGIESLSAIWTGEALFLWSTWYSPRGALYHPETDAWSIVRAPPEMRSIMGPAVAWIAAREELFSWGGGVTGDGGYSGEGWRYALKSSMWTRLPPSPLSPGFGVAASVDARVVVSKGAEAAEYDANANEWHALAPSSSSSPWLRLGSMIDATHAIFWGSWSDACTDDSLDGATFDFTDAAWTSVPTIALDPLGRSHVQAWAGGGRLFMFGGVSGCDGAPSAAGAVFDRSTGAWFGMPTGPLPAADASRSVGVWTGCESIVCAQNQCGAFRP